MKKLIWIIVLGLILNACTTAREEISKGAIKPGINKIELRNFLLSTSPSEDAFMGGCYRQYYSNIRLEVLSSSSRSAYYIFENVFRPTVKCERIQLGDGKLAVIKYSLSDVEIFINNKKQKKTVAKKQTKLKKTETKKTETPKKKEEKEISKEEDSETTSEEDTLEAVLKDVYGDRKLDNIEGLWGYRRDDEKEGRIYLIFKSDDYLYEEQVIYHPIREFEGQISTKIVKKIDNNLYETKATWLNVDKVDVRNGTIKIIDKFKLKFETSRHCYSSEKECLKAGVVYKKKIWPSKTYADDIGLTNKQSDVLKGLLD